MKELATNEIVNAKIKAALEALDAHLKEQLSRDPEFIILDLDIKFMARSLDTNMNNSGGTHGIIVTVTGEELLYSKS